MRIAHVTDCHLPRIGGIERQAEGLTRAQTASGHDWRRWPITWTAVSEVAAASLSEVLRPHSAISVLPNGVTPALWSVRPLPRDPNRVVIVSVMRLAARKRPLHFLKTLRAVRAQVPAGVRLQVRIVGDGPRREAMRHYLDRHQMSDWVQLTGQLDQPAIRELFRDADLYASPATLARSPGARDELSEHNRTTGSG